ncbi:hypothetical protein BB561_001686 [Smittium simulii]|uniref:Uncharacterized protein n=1 Tax=Smittium simulii TaxID=133385 RepID=A0A2T9YTK4_9FUNG|nr:hypothetical protein BB561_001686 [Smittium simulii]
MDQETLNHIKELTEKVNQLLRERGSQEETEDPHVTTRIPVTDLTAYPELIEALPSIEEDFFRSPLTDEERKNALYSCPKNNSITRYIHSISVLIHQNQDTPIPKGRAIGATLAANSGVSTDDIVSHAFWSNYSIFDSYYRLTRNSSNNLTESILNLE